MSIEMWYLDDSNLVWKCSIIIIMIYTANDPTLESLIKLSKNLGKAKDISNE